MAELILEPDKYTIELINDSLCVKDSNNKLVAQFPNNEDIKDCHFRYYGNNTIVAYELQYDMYERNFKLLNIHGNVISPSKSYHNMKLVQDTDIFLCLHSVENKKAFNGWVDVYDVINCQGEILLENILKVESQPAENQYYEQLPIHYFDISEVDVTKFLDGDWDDSKIKVLDIETLQELKEGLNNDQAN